MNPNQALWEKGDFTRIAQSMRESGETLVQRLDVTKGLKVLDLGCGDGTTALPSAKLGADVLGVDIATNLVEAGNRRAKQEGHEKVHQFFVAKLYILREYRVANRVGSYVRSSIYRYFEEMLAETIAQVGVNGFKQAFVGLRFPVKNGYVFLMKAGSSLAASWKGSGVLVEGAALIYTGVVSGVGYNLYFTAGSP